jgi:hypothetical protein
MKRLKLLGERVIYCYQITIFQEYPNLVLSHLHATYLHFDSLNIKKKIVIFFSMINIAYIETWKEIIQKTI